MGSPKHRWTIAGVGSLSVGAGVLFWLTAPTDLHNAGVSASPEQVVGPVARAPIAPDHFSPSDRKIFQHFRTIAQTEHWDHLHLGALTQRVGKSFLGSDYKANLLDRAANQATGHEVLTASLQQFDCVLFVETALALAQMLRQPNLSDAQAEQVFFAALQQYRYRNGILGDYCSRLHYFSDWILDHDRRGLVQDLGRSLDGVPLNRSLFFMSQHWEKYPVLVAHPEFRNCIIESESTIDTSHVFYIPTQAIAQHYSKLQPGDVVGIVTHIKGLDVTHSGLIHQQLNSRNPMKPPSIGLMHASLKSGIKISPDLATYVAGVDGAIGIVVARPLPLK